MQDKDPFSFQFNKNQISSTRAEESSLITLERSQKLDLLIHLITNLRQSLVICGPNGIGKTTVLSELKDRKNNIWPIVTIQSSEILSFEGIQKQIVQFLIQYDSKHKNQGLSSVLSSLDKQNQKVVVLIDNSGQLVPGLISNIIQYAIASESLRIVFSLTQDELHLKNSSDKSINDCHFIEIPPLTEKQCGIFLQNLSSKPNAGVSYSAINEQLVEKVYRQTHGIPGKIVSELPKFSDYKSSTAYQWLVGVFFLSVIVAAGVRLFVLDESNAKLENKHGETPLVLKKVEDIKASPTIYTDIQGSIDFKPVEQPEKSESFNKKSEIDVAQIPVDSISDKKLTVIDEIENTIIKEKQSQSEELDKKPLVQKEVDENKKKQQVAENKEVIAEKPIITDKVIEKSPPVTKKIKEIAEKKGEDSLSIETVKNDSQWLFDQPKQNYTIQLMVLSKRKSAELFIRKNKKLTEQLKFFQLNKQSEKYVLIYGSFKKLASASKQMKSLPAKYRKSWIRRIKALQKEIKK